KDLPIQIRHLLPLMRLFLRFAGLLDLERFLRATKDLRIRSAVPFILTGPKRVLTPYFAQLLKNTMPKFIHNRLWKVFWSFAVRAILLPKRFRVLRWRFLMLPTTLLEAEKRVEKR